MAVGVAVVMTVAVGSGWNHGKMLYYNITGVHACLDTASQFSRLVRPEVLLEFTALLKERTRGRPGARCTRGLACKCTQRKRTRAYRFSGSTPAFPAQWLYGLLRGASAFEDQADISLTVGDFRK